MSVDDSSPYSIEEGLRLQNLRSILDDLERLGNFNEERFRELSKDNRELPGLIYQLKEALAQVAIENMPIILKRRVRRIVNQIYIPTSLLNTEAEKLLETTNNNLKTLTEITSIVYEKNQNEG